MRMLLRPARQVVLPLADLYDSGPLAPEPTIGSRIYFVSTSAEARNAFLTQARVVRSDFAVLAAGDVASLPAEPSDAADATTGVADSMVAVVVDCRQNHTLADAVFARLRAGTLRRHTHVMVLINATEAEKAWAILGDADDVLVDPFTLLDLQLRLRNVCRAVRRQQDVERLSIVVDGVAGQAHLLQAPRPFAYTDRLTGLPNRLYLDNWVAERGRRRDDVGFGIHRIGLDGFAAVNDHHGHHVGDPLLRMVGERLSRTMRALDVVAHLGDGEIAAIQLDATCGDDLRAFAGRLLAVFDDAFVLAGQSIRIDACIGSALHPIHGDTLSDLLHRAGVAMAVARSIGFGTFRMFQGSPGSTPPPLAAALQATPCYGLAFSLAGGAFRGAYVEPGAGTMLAEGGDHEAALDQDPLLDLGVAFTQAVRWSLVTCPLVFSASVDAAFFTRADAIGRIRDLLLETGADPAQCEVTLRAPNGLEEVGSLYRLRDLGLGLGAHVEADTFMLQRMLRLPLTRLHLDRQFTRGDATMLAEATVRFARSIRARTLGHGIVTRGDMETLLRLGVDDVTGQYVSPLASNDKLLLLRQRIAAGQRAALHPLKARLETPLA